MHKELTDLLTRRSLHEYLIEVLSVQKTKRTYVVVYRATAPGRELEKVAVVDHDLQTIYHNVVV